MRFARRSPSVLALVTSLILVASVAHAGVVADPVKTGPRDQFGGTGNADYFAWTQDAAGSNGLDVWVDPTVGSSYKVDGAGVGFADAVDQTGSMLSWQLIKQNTSDVNLFDMAAIVDVPLPSGINTNGWECCSGVFGNTFTFIRTTKNAFKLFLVTDLSTGDKIKVTTINRPNLNLWGAPRVYDNWIVWSVFGKSGWKVYRYDITNDVIDKIPNPDPQSKFYYAPSVDVIGNVYFIRSGKACGAAVRLMKWDGSGNPSVSFAFDGGTDSFTTSVFDDGLGTVIVYVDSFDCSAGKSDIYSLTNP